MTRRFRSYQPSTALRQAIEALNEAKRNRAAMEAGGGQSHTASGPVLPIHNSPGSDTESVTSRATTPGQESADIGEGSGAGTDIDALVSGRKTSTRED